MLLTQNLQCFVVVSNLHRRTFALASIGILNPGGTAATKSLQLLSLQLATPLILLGADLRDCVQRCGPLLLSFAVASMATLVGKFYFTFSS